VVTIRKQQASGRKWVIGGDSTRNDGVSGGWTNEGDPGTGPVDAACRREPGINFLADIKLV